MLNYINIRELKIGKNFLKEQKNIFDIDKDFFPTSDDMMNNVDNIIKCINSTDDINLIILHRSLYILKRKFEQNKVDLQKIYKKYGEYLKKEENILIDENLINKLLKEIFNLNKFEISSADDFSECMNKELNYCKEVNMEEYILNEFISFLKYNRKRYNFIFREKRNNTVFNLENYDQLEYNLVDDLTKEVEIGIFDNEEEENDLNNYIKNFQKNKIPSAKYRNKLVLENPKNINKDNIKINLDLIKKNKNTIESNEDNTYSYSESDIGLSSRGKNIESKNINTKEGESGSGTLRSKISLKRKNEENNNNIIEENIDEEKESVNRAKNDEKNENKTSSEEDNENSFNSNNNENNENIKDNDYNNINNIINENKNENENKNVLDENADKNKSSQLLFSSKKKKIEIKEKVFYETKYKKKEINVKSIKFLKHYLYIDILPLIIADFISDERNLYLILDHSDDFRNSLSKIFDVEILSKLGEDYLEEALNQKIKKLEELKKNKSKIEKNIENYEKLSNELKEKNQNITYILITLQKLREFLNWLNTKMHVLQNDISIFKEYEINKKEKERIFNMNKNMNESALNNKKAKKQAIIDNYKQMKRDLEIRKFMIQKNKMMNSFNNKKKLKPLKKNININTTNNNNNSNNNISNIENENSNNNIDSAEMSDDYNNTFFLSENNLSNKKKPNFYYPKNKVKKLNFKNSYDDIMTEKKVNSEDEDDIIPLNIDNDNILDNDEESDNNDNMNEEKQNNSNNNNELNTIDNSNKRNILKNKKTNESNKVKSNNKSVKFKDDIIDNEKNINENNIYNNIKLNDDMNDEENEQNDDKVIINNKIGKNTNISQKINTKIKENKKTKKILKSIHYSNVNNTNNNVVNNNPYKINNNKENENAFKNNKNKSNIKNDKKVNKKVRYVLKKIEEPKNLSRDEKREIAIKEIFDYYTNKNTILENKSSTFDKIKSKSGHLSLNEYCRFCNDFKIPLTKDKIFSLFNKLTSNNSKIMTFQEFKLSLISMSFSINDFQVEEINRSIDIFIGKTKAKNKERSRFEKYNEKEMETNKKIIKEKMEKIEILQKKQENELIEEFFEFLEIDDPLKYRKKMKGIYNANSITEVSLPKINVKDNALVNNQKNKYSKNNSVLTYNKKENINAVPRIQKINIGKQFWVKSMVDKEKGDTPIRQRYIYDDEDSEEQKDDNLPVIESNGIPLFSKNKKNENKNYDNY